MAFQTSCVSAANIVTGLTFQQDVVADAEGRELVQHGSALFPIAGDRALLLFLDSLGIGITPS